VVILYEKTNITLKQYQKDELYKIIDDKILEFMMSENSRRHWRRLP